MGVVVGSVAIPGSTGNFSVSGLAFQPVAVILFNQFDHLSPHSMTFGCATSSTEQWAVWTGTDTEASVYGKRYHEGRTDRCIFNYQAPFTTLSWSASLVSMNSDGFTLNLDDRVVVGGGEGGNIYYMALGGDHITEAHAGTFAAGNGTGTTSVTDPGFTPTSLIVAHVADTAFDGGQITHMSLGVGVTDGISQYASYCLGIAFTDVSVWHIHNPNALALYKDSAQYLRMNLESFDGTGFTVDISDALTVDLTFGYLAINAEGAVAGSGVQPDSNGTEDYSTPGLLPGGVFFCWPGVDAPSTSGSTAAPLRPGVGAGTISQQRESTGIYRASTSFGVFTSDGFQIGDESMGFWGTGNAIGGGDDQSQASADISSFVDGSFELTWSNVADTNDRAFGWLALPGELTFRPQFYRVQPGGRIS